MPKLRDGILLQAKRRAPIHLTVIFIVWPVISFAAAVLSALYIPYVPLSLGQAALVSCGGMAVMAPDILAVGVVALIVSLAVFSPLAHFGLINQTGNRIRLAIEPVTLFGATLLGASLYYPSALSQPILLLFWIFPVWAATMALAVIVITLSRCLAAPGRRDPVVAIILLFAILAPLPGIFRNRMPPAVSSAPPVVLLGIDSVSLHDDLSRLERWTQDKGGAWYMKAVSPGLLTNSVWSSILLMKPISEHGVFHTFQSIPDASNGSLIKEARKQGYYTVSKFSDQMTCYVGSDYAFDRNLSGPIGWRQLATSIYENASILLPLVRPILPWLPFSSVPPNHAGVYTYSIEREINEIMTTPSTKGTTLVVGHSTYLHIPAYPMYMDMSWSERKRVLFSPQYKIKDRSLDWQDADRPDDPIPLRQWKLKRIQAVLTETVERTRFLERGGRMIFFSDHGDRNGISNENFHEDRYHNVMFATFNLPVRDTSLPISTIDSGSILGLAQHEPFAPIVEYANSAGAEWPMMAKSAKIEWSGRVFLNNDLLSTIFRRLRSHRPISNAEQTMKTQ